MTANDSSALPGSDHSTAPTIGEATMPDHSSVDALSDGEVGRRLRRIFRTAATAREDDEYPDDLYEWEFVSFVIPALDERGLGEKYVEEIARRLWPHSDQVAWYADEVWTAFKALLSLRARAALTVLENTNG